jgi:hypothetical protein
MLAGREYIARDQASVERPGAPEHSGARQGRARALVSREDASPVAAGHESKLCRHALASASPGILYSSRAGRPAQSRRRGPPLDLPPPGPKACSLQRSASAPGPLTGDACREQAGFAASGRHLAEGTGAGETRWRRLAGVQVRVVTGIGGPAPGEASRWGSRGKGGTIGGREVDLREMSEKEKDAGRAGPLPHSRGRRFQAGRRRWRGLPRCPRWRARVVEGER